MKRRMSGDDEGRKEGRKKEASRYEKCPMAQGKARESGVRLWRKSCLGASSPTFPVRVLPSDTCILLHK